MAENKKFPFEIRDLEPRLAKELMKQFTGELTGFVRVGPKGYFFPHKYKEEALNIYSMSIRSSDFFVASYPRSGNTWTQELVWMVANDLDYDTSNAIPLSIRYPFLEYSVFVHTVLKKQMTEENSDSEIKLQQLDQMTRPAVKHLADMQSPRFIKTHLPMSLLPPSLLDVAKMVYVARDPRDVAVSSFYLNRTIRVHGYIGDFKMYWKYFINDLSYWAPYFEHLKEAWAQRDHPNMLFLFYEELAKDLPAAVHRVATFFGKQFNEEQISGLCQHTNIENFKKNNSVNEDFFKKLGMTMPGEQPFIRIGKVGGWRDYFDDDMTRQAEQWIQDNLRDSDLCFPHLKNISN